MYEIIDPEKQISFSRLYCKIWDWTKSFWTLIHFLSKISCCLKQEIAEHPIYIKSYCMQREKLDNCFKESYNLVEWVIITDIFSFLLHAHWHTCVLQFNPSINLHNISHTQVKTVKFSHVNHRFKAKDWKLNPDPFPLTTSSPLNSKKNCHQFFVLELGFLKSVKKEQMLNFLNTKGDSPVVWFSNSKPH